MTRLPFPPVKLEKWPAQDRDFWFRAQRPAGLFDNGGLASNWQPATLRNCERAYGVYLHWLASTGQLDLKASPCDRISEERIQAFIEAYRTGRAELTVAGAVRGVAYVLRACAPPDGVPWLTRFAHRLTNNGTLSRSKLPRMARVKEILTLGYELMKAGLADVQAGRVSGAVKYRDGLMIALLIQRPIRRRNLAALRIHHTITFNDYGIHIRFSGDETKTGRAIDFAVPKTLVPDFGKYIEFVRPMFLRRVPNDEGWLWLGRRGRHMSESDISVRISKVTRQHLGRSISPHLFRDCVATEIALEDPSHIGITKSVLNHATLKSSQKFYNQATSFTAFSRYQDMLDGLKNPG